MTEKNTSKSTDRRNFLKTVGAGVVSSTVLGASAAVARAQHNEAVRGSRIAWARMKYPSINGRSDDWGHHPTGDIKLIQAVRRSTNINIMRDWHVAEIDDLERMVDFPFIFLHGQLPVAFTPKQQDNLKEYLMRGGFLFVDDCVLSHGNTPDAFYSSVVPELHKALPGAQWKLLDKDHEIFHNVFDMKLWPHMQGADNGLTAVYYQKRMVALVASSDLHCGWVQVNWFDDRLERDATRMGVNIYAYAISH